MLVFKSTSQCLKSHSFIALILWQRQMTVYNWESHVMPVWFPQGAQQSSETVSWVSGGAGGTAGVGQRRAASADQQPGHQLLLRPVSTHEAWGRVMENHTMRQ